MAFDVGCDARYIYESYTSRTGTYNLEVLGNPEVLGGFEGARVDNLITTNSTGEFDLYIF